MLKVDEPPLADAALSFLVVILLQGSGQPGGGPSIGGPNELQSPSTALTISPAITPELILGAIILATLVGMLAGLLPSWRASKLPPVDALRIS